MERDFEPSELGISFGGSDATPMLPFHGFLYAVRALRLANMSFVLSLTDQFVGGAVWKGSAALDFHVIPAACDWEPDGPFAAQLVPYRQKGLL
jgi:hypothetical protein